MDALHWGPNWTEPSSDEVFHTKIHKALDGDSWVLDGNYTRSAPVKWRYVDMVIWIDFSFTRTLLQALKRAVLRATFKNELWPGTGNTESFRKSFFSKDSIVLWTINTYHKNRIKHLGIMADDEYKHIRFVQLRSPIACERFLARMKENLSADAADKSR